MKQLVGALEDKHPGSTVIDIRFSLEPGVDSVVIDEQMDRALAKAIREAVEVDIGDLCGS